MTALGQHYMVPPFYAHRGKVAACARTAREAPSMHRVYVCVCVCVICTFYEVDPYAAMRWQVYSAQYAVASLRL